MSTASSRLVELRHKTDRQMLIVIQRELDRGLTLASLVSSRRSQLYIRAEKAYEKAASVLAKLDGALGQDERRHVESTFRELRASLDNVPAQKIQRSTATFV